MLADEQIRPKWPRWRVVLTYAILFALAAGSIWFIDRDATWLASEPTTVSDPTP